MASEPNAPRSRRALLTAAAGAAGAIAANAAMPLTAAAAPTPMLTETDNTATAQTSVTQSAAGAVAFKVRTTNPDAAALLASTGDESGIETDTAFTGVYAWAPEAPVAVPPAIQYEGSAVWGDSPDDGVVGTGGLTGVIGFGGSEGIVGRGGASGAGVRAIGANTRNALVVSGKVQFSRSGRATIGSGKSSVKVSLLGTSSSSRVFAVLHSNRSGRYVRAVVPTTGSFTIYLNTTVTSSTYVAWFVIN
jgi:hypothetical protein